MTFFKIYKLSEFQLVTDDDIKYFEIEELIDLYFAYIYDDSKENIKDMINKTQNIFTKQGEIKTRIDKIKTQINTINTDDEKKNKIIKKYSQNLKDSNMQSMTIEPEQNSKPEESNEVEQNSKSITSFQLSHGQYLHHTRSIYDKYNEIKTTEPKLSFDNIEINNNSFFKENQYSVFLTDPKKIHDYTTDKNITQYSIEELLNIYFAYSPKLYINKILFKLQICEWLREKDILNRGYFLTEFVYKLLIGNKFDIRRIGPDYLNYSSDPNTNKNIINFDRILVEFNILCNCVYDTYTRKLLYDYIIEHLNKTKNTKTDIDTNTDTDTQIDTKIKLVETYKNNDDPTQNSKIEIYIISCFTIDNETITSAESKFKCFYKNDKDLQKINEILKNENKETNNFIMVNEATTRTYENVTVDKTIHPASNTKLFYCDKEKYDNIINKIIEQPNQ